MVVFKVSLRFCWVCSHCSHLKKVHYPSTTLYLAVISLCLGVACGILENEFFGDSEVIRAQCLARRWLHVLRQYLAFG